MTQHFQRNVRGVLKWCNTCGKATMHRVDDRRVGNCLEQHVKAHGLLKWTTTDKGETWTSVCYCGFEVQGDREMERHLERNGK